MDSESGSEDEMDTQDVMEHGYAVGGLYDYVEEEEVPTETGVNLTNP